MENVTKISENATANLEKVNNQLFNVVKLPLVPQGDLQIFGVATLQGLYRSNGGNCLGTVGGQFEPMQPKEFFDNIVGTVEEFGANLDLSTLKFKEYNGGTNIEFSIKMHPISFKNNKGIQDVTNLEITFSTAYNGTKSNTISLYTERLVCTNGMVANKLEGTLKGRNTVRGKATILSYQKELAELINGAEKFKEKMIELDKKVLSKKEIEKFKLDLFGYNREMLEASDKTETTRLELLKKIEDSIEIEFARTGETAFGLLQGITHYTNHSASRKRHKGQKDYTRDEYIRFNQGFKTNSKAQEILFAMVEA